MENLKTITLADGVHHIHESLDVCCTLIVGTKAALLIDTGYGFGDISGKVKAITDLPVTVINSHGHADHVQGNKFFDHVLLHKDDGQLIRFHSSFIVKLFVYLASRKQLNTAEKKNLSSYFQKNNRSAAYVDDGHLIDLGDRVLEVIHTPGHTRGSICILDKKDRILFAGDAFSNDIWLFQKESATVGEFIQGLLKVIERKPEFDSILFSHSTVIFKTAVLDKVLHCVKHIDVRKSERCTFPLAGKALVYSEGLDTMRIKYGYKTYVEFREHASDLDQTDIANGEFVSIAYSKTKLR